MIKNPFNLPRDIRFLILQNFKPHELLNLYLVNKDCAKICKDENFWLRKLQKDYPAIDSTKYHCPSFLELYKRLAGKIGKLFRMWYKQESKKLPNGSVETFWSPLIERMDNVSYLISNQIIDNDTHLIIDALNQLRVINQKNPFATLFGLYLDQIYPGKYDHVFINVQRYYNNWDLLYDFNDQQSSLYN